MLAHEKKRGIEFGNKEYLKDVEAHRVDTKSMEERFAPAAMYVCPNDIEKDNVNVNHMGGIKKQRLVATTSDINDISDTNQLLVTYQQILSNQPISNGANQHEPEGKGAMARRKIKRCLNNKK
jgi:hypothetical protein